MHSNNIDERVCKTLSSLELAFFSALQSGSEALASFDRSWLAFATQVENCVGQLQQQTKAKIYSFASTANIVALNLLEVDNAGENLHRQLRQDVMQILREEFSHLSIQDHSPSSDVQQPNSAYIPRAYKWLLENLHNPYPSREIRLTISESTNSLLKDVDAWFIDARKRIGWNQLRKDHFPKRSELIKAATRFFKPTHSVIPLSSLLKSTTMDDRYLDFANQFAQMEDHARELYSGKLFPSQLASGLKKTELSTRPNAMIQERSERGRSLALNADQRTSYPSPEYSPARASVSLSPPPQTPKTNEYTNRKRKRSTSSTDTLSDVEQPEQLVSRTAKRSKFNAPEIDSEAAVKSLPSPASSVHDSLAEESPSISMLPLPTYKPVQSLPKRKRALSDVDDRIAKRPSNLPSNQRLQTVSDPISLSAHPTEQSETNSEDYLAEILGIHHQIIHDIPAAVTKEDFDEFSEFEIECYNYDFSHLLVPVNGNHNCNDTESPTRSDCPELLDDSILPQLQTPATSSLWVSDTPPFNINLEKANDIPPLWEFDTPSATPGSEFWQPTLTNNGDMLSSGWVDDCRSIGVDSLPPHAFWQLDHLSNNSTSTDYFDISATSGFPFFDSTPTKTPAQLTYNAKCQKINQLQKILAQAAVLRSEIAQ